MNYSEVQCQARIGYGELYDDLCTLKNPDPISHILIDSVYLTAYELFKVTVEWIIQDTLLNPSLFTFFVERSGSPSGPFERISGGLKNEYVYTDNGAPNFSKQNTLFYRIAISKDSVNEIYYSRAEDYHNKPDFTALEIAHRNKLLLTREVGVSCVVYKRRHWGKRCLECWDIKLSRRTKTKCSVCYDTGYEGGYWSAVPAMINFSPTQSMVAQTPWGKLEPNATTVWMGNYPPMEPEDIVVEVAGNKRWVVKNFDSKEKRRFVLKQILQVEELSKGRVEYGLPINIYNGDSELSSSYSSIESLLLRLARAVNSYINNETVKGATDGVNKSFETTYAYKQGTLKIYLNGMRLNEGGDNDFTEDGSRSITFNSPPGRGDIIIADYVRAY